MKPHAALYTEIQISRFTPQLGYEVELRNNGSDNEVWDATFNHQYHVPPPIQPTTVLDLGANIGLTAAHYATLWPLARIVAVEMDLDNAELAQKNAPGCKVICKAVAGTDRIAFYDTEPWPSGFRLGTTGKRAYCETLRSLIEQNFNNGFVDFVKMDVEGAEWEILANGDWALLVGSLLVELHGEVEDELMVSCAISSLEDLGFSATHHEIHPRAVWATR